MHQGSFLDTPIEFIKGVGPQRAEVLKKELSIHTVGDFLSHYPYRYEDRSVVYPISQIGSGEVFLQIQGVLSAFELVGEGKARRLTCWLRDGTGQIELIWFQGISYVHKNLQPGQRYLVFGRVSEFKGKLSIAHPEVELIKPHEKPAQKGLVPVYPLTDSMRRRYLDNKFMSQVSANILAMPGFEIPENLPAYILEKQQLVARQWAISMLHRPKNPQNLQLAENRLKFEELFYLQIRHLQLKSHRNRTLKGLVFEKLGEHFNGFYKNHLPFELTDAQKKVLKEIRKDMVTGRQMNRLLQGDVGSGKTIVAILAMLIALDNGYQSCIMAPTEILASQHYAVMQELLEGTGIKTALLTGSTTKKNREKLLAELKSGEISILTGTHALIENDVDFAQLGLVVIDEQHRFGVAQRAKLWRKGNRVPHILVMTATPIPRTLAMTVYSDLEVSTIDQLPSGRKQIVTVHRHDNTRPLIMQFVREEVGKGRQVYVVFPLIEDSPKLELKSLMTGYEVVAEYLPPPAYKYSMLHGKLKPAEKDIEMGRFKSHATDIMVATTVIEVGVNVPNASVMIIENAERFGLAQLHQLRGRVGRGAEQSYCILVTGGNLSAAARKRIQTMVATTDGFQIAQVDMELRGPGDMDGTRQSGLLELKLSDIRKDEALLLASRAAAEALLEDDATFEKPENAAVKLELSKIPHRTVWSKIS